ncbi:hypothetical protein ABN034_07305 [Actinopolymorpha sp. B11F2]|uniref:hypothetical protein n=1 Tax=Actinopolymorpha sp. B11F2 TaxID=3160862 RepID=UPI0032E49B0A
MSRSTYASTHPVRRARGLVLALVGAMVGLLALGPGTAHAGGPTSVLVVSPQKGVTASAYHSDDEYALLTRALDESPVAQKGAPVDQVLDPGGSQINVTWLMHDISIWRLDRILVDTEKGVWINTREAWEGDLVDLDGAGVWHRSPDPEGLLALLGSWGMLDGTASLPVESVPQPADEAAADEVASPANPGGARNENVNGLNVPSGTRDSGVLGMWWLALPALLLGALGGALGRPAASRLVRRAQARAFGPRQHLIDA